MADARSGIRAAQAGLLINAALAGIKLAAGIIGNTYALVADAVESMADVFACRGRSRCSSGWWS